MYNDFEKKYIEFFWEFVNPDFHMQISFSLCILLCSRFPFDTWTSPIMHLLCPIPPPPQFCVAFVFNSLGYYSCPKKIEDTPHAKFEGKTKCIKGDVQVANYVI